MGLVHLQAPLRRRSRGGRDRLDHLASLGVTAIYFNPVFEAESHHKYESTDYRHVDTSLGAGEDWEAVAAKEDLSDPSTWSWSPSDRLFLDLVEACHERGMKVVIDGVWNHVGQRHPAFADVLARGPESPYADWFDVVSWKPFVHRGWAGFDDLPVFKKDANGLASDAVVEHIHAVTRRWMDPNGDGDPSDGVDGWRLDVPMEIPMPFWDEWRQVVKSINPDAYLSGEVWDRADAWLDGRRFDAVMNYRFADAAVAWIGFEERKITPTELDRRLAELRLAYPAEATYALMNLVGSHDTDRLVSMFLNPDRRYDADNREQDGVGYLNRKPDPIHYRRARLAALFQMTYVGAPMIYYGDEVGMWGPDDPSNRKPMLWADLEPYDRKEAGVDEEHLAHYRAIGQLRRAHPALRTGSFETLVTNDQQDLFVFLREDADERIWSRSMQVHTLRASNYRLELGKRSTAATVAPEGSGARRERTRPRAAAIALRATARSRQIGTCLANDMATGSTILVRARAARRSSRLERDHRTRCTL